MRKWLLCIAGAGFILAARAQPVRTPVRAAYTNFTAYDSSFADAFTFTGNQATLAEATHFKAGLYSERRFMLQELSLHQFAFIIPTTSGNLGIAANYFGNSDQNEAELGLAYGRKLSKTIWIGTQFTYYNLQTKGYGSAATVSADIALALLLSSRLQMGLQVANLSRPTIGKEYIEQLPFIYNMSLGYKPAVNCYLAVAIEKAELQPITLKPAIQYIITDKIMARAGAETASGIFYIGLGTPLRYFRLDAVATIHPQLGFTPGLQLTYAPKERSW